MKHDTESLMNYSIIELLLRPSPTLCLATALAIAGGVCLMSPLANATAPQSPSPEDARLQEAFARGLGELSEAGSLSVERFGRTVVLKGYSPDKTLIKTLRCALCTPHEALTSARSLGAWMAIHGTDIEPAMLAVSSPDRLSRVAVDELPLAPLNTPALVEPGSHEVVVQLASTTVRHHLELDPGDHLELVINHSPPMSRGIISPATAVILGGLGLTAGAIGGAFLWLDGNPRGNNNQQHELTVAGWTLIAAGIITEGVMLFLAWPRNRPAAEEK